MRVQVQVTGVEEVRESLRRVGEAGVPVAKRVLKAFTDRVVPRVKDATPVSPEDGGQLRDSVRATRPTVTKKGVISAGVVAGGAPLERLASEAGHKDPGIYGVAQHEDMTKRHTVGGPKFVENPFMQEAPAVPDELLEELDVENKGEGV